MIGTVVLAKIGGYPRWPAVIVEANEAPKEALRKGADVMVRFFGTKDYMQLQESAISPFVYSEPKQHQLRRSFIEAKQYIESHSEPPSLPGLDLEDHTVADACGTGEESDNDSDALSVEFHPISEVGPTTSGSMFGQPPSTNLPSAQPRERRTSSETDVDFIPGDVEDNSTSNSECGEDDTIDPVQRCLNEVTDVVEGVRANPTPSRRRRKRPKPNEWKRQKAKLARATGSELRNDDDVVIVAEKRPIEVDCSKCRFKCSDQFSMEDRDRICASYYALGDYKRQKDFLLRHMPTVPVKRRSTGQRETRRGASYHYKFEDSRNADRRVCQKFFLKTLGMTNDMRLRSARAGQGNQGHFASEDRRGRYDPPNKTPTADIEKVREHILSFPVMDPHYIRQKSVKRYLEPGLNKSRMYQLYREWAPLNGVQTLVGFQVYKNILEKDFHLGFFQPKKDQCLVCAKRAMLEGEDRVNYEESVFRPHRERRFFAQQEKAMDKLKASQCEEYMSVTFDLQAVLSTPCTDVSQVYYRRKLSVYNLTVYQQSPPNDAFCYLWDECTAKRGSNEIGSCLLMYLTQLPAQISRISLYSDNCGGQNMNLNVSAALLHHVCNSPHLKVIDHKFLEAGHTYMEVDAMHSAIEFAKKKQKIYAPSEWENLIIGARRCNPFNTVQLTQEKVCNLKALAEAIVMNRKSNADGESVSWNAIKWFRYDKDFPTSIFYKTGYDECGFKEIPIQKGRGRVSADSPCGLALTTTYSSGIPISTEKKKDLMELVRIGVIPATYAPFYANLPASGHALDLMPVTLPEEEDRRGD